MNRVLITGGAGFIGSHTADLLLAKGFEVTIIDNLHEKNHINKLFPEYLDSRINKVFGDINNESLMLSLLSKTDYVIHLAAEMDLNPDFQKFMNVNVGGTALLYEIILKNKLIIKKIIIASTQFIYGEGIWNCQFHGTFKPDHRHKLNFEKSMWDHVCPICLSVSNYIKNTEIHSNPPNHYALSKYFEEQLALKLGKLYSIPTISLRYSIVHGPRQSLKNTYSGALRNFAISINFGLNLSTFEDNESLRDFISVKDVASANLFMLESDESTNYEIYNVSGDVAYSIKDLANMISFALKKEYVFSNLKEYRVGDIRHALSSNNKIKSLGWKPLYDEKSTIKEYIDWFLTQTIDLEAFKTTQKKIRNLNIVVPINIK